LKKNTIKNAINKVIGITKYNTITNDPKILFTMNGITNGARIESIKRIIYTPKNKVFLLALTGRNNTCYNRSEKGGKLT
jgi:hypothetical protein